MPVGQSIGLGSQRNAAAATAYYETRDIAVADPQSVSGTIDIVGMPHVRATISFTGGTAANLNVFLQVSFGTLATGAEDWISVASAAPAPVAPGFSGVATTLTYDGAARAARLLYDATAGGFTATGIRVALSAYA